MKLSSIKGWVELPGLCTLKKGKDSNQVQHRNMRKRYAKREQLSLNFLYKEEYILPKKMMN